MCVFKGISLHKVYMYNSLPPTHTHTHAHTTHTQAGYTPLMLAAACCVEVGEHRDIMGHLVDRGDINKAADKVSLSPSNTIRVNSTMHALCTVIMIVL